MALVFFFCLSSLSHVFPLKLAVMIFLCVEEKHVAVRGWDCPKAAGDWLVNCDETCLNDRGERKGSVLKRRRDMWEEVEALGPILIDLADTSYVSCARQK